MSFRTNLLRDSIENCPGGEISPEDPRDWVLDDISMVPGGLLDDLPESYMLDIPLGPFDQGNNHSCGACVGALLMEIHESLGLFAGSPMTRDSHTKKSRQRRLSAGFIYHHRVNSPARGMFGRDVFKILSKIGVSTEERYPTPTRELTEEPSSQAYRSAGRRRISGYAKIGTASTLKRAIVEIGPAYMLLPYRGKYKDFWREKAWQKRDYTRDIYGDCHAVAVIGYNPDGFYIVSSWGSSWGDQGIALFPYTDWHVVREVWVPLRRHEDEKKQSFARVIKAPFGRVNLAGEPADDRNRCC